jgi:hypothetical protein
MHPKIKRRPAGATVSTATVKPLLLHDVTNPKASAAAASRRRRIASQPAAGPANHARHHVPRQSQS